MDGERSTRGKYEKGIKFLVGKPERKRPLRRSRRRWKHNIRMDRKGNRVESCRLNGSGSG